MKASTDRRLDGCDRGHRQSLTAAEHPRRRLLESGARSLSDTELVEVLLRNGRRSSRAWEQAGWRKGLFPTSPTEFRSPKNVTIFSVAFYS